MVRKLNNNNNKRKSFKKYYNAINTNTSNNKP